MAEKITKIETVTDTQKDDYGMRMFALKWACRSWTQKPELILPNAEKFYDFLRKGDPEA